MKKIFTKLFLLTTLLMLSSELWAQAPEYVTCSSTLQSAAGGYATRVILENTNNYDCSPDVISFKTTAQEEPYPFQRASVYGDGGGGFGAIGLLDIHGAIVCSLEQNFNNNPAGEQSYTFNLPEGVSGQYIYGLMIEHGRIQFKDFKITNYYYTWEASKSINAAASTYSFEVDYSAYGIPTKASDLSVELTGDNSSAFKVTSEDLGNKVRYTVTYNHNTVGDHYARLKVNYNSTICGNSVTGHARALNLHGQTTKVTPTVTAWPTLDAVTYGTNFGDALQLKGGSASVPGTFKIANNYNAGSVPNAGTYNYNVTFTPNDVSTYNTVNKYVVLTVNKANQSITWDMGNQSMYVGGQLTLNATASSGLGVTYTSSNTSAVTVSGNTLTAVGEGNATITASQAGNGNYNAATDITYTVSVSKATPTVTAWPTLNAVTYGATLEQALVLVGGEASVAGTFVITDTYTAATVPNAGAHTYSVEFRPTESNKYNNVSGGTATLTVNRANQTIAWTATPPTEMTVGDTHTLSATALGGAVAFAISGDAATLADNTLTAVQAGTVTITASQAGNGNYNAAANVTHTITINKATPTVSAWSTLDTVTYGATLEQALVLVGGTASVEGTFVITDAYTAATIPNAGAHTYSVEFRPTESNKYNNVSGGTATLTVNKADQAIAWTATPPTEMTVGDSHTLSATAPGGAVSYAVTGDAVTRSGNTLTAEQAGSVTITASQAGNGNYNAAANVTHTITINKATPTVSAWSTLDTVTYGATLEQALVLVGGTASVEGTFVITDAYTAATVPNAGTHTYSVEFRPTESNKYNNVSGGTATLVVNKADQAIAWTATPPTEMTVGDSHTLSATAPGGAVAFAITGDAATLADNTLTAVQAGTVTITASQAGNGNYNAAANVTHTITINKATPTVTAWPTLDAVTYGAKLEQALVLVGGTASVEGTFVITDAYTAATIPNAGAHTYSVEFRPTESNKYNNVSGGTATLTVNKADQVIAWTATPPTEMTVGDSHTLSATALGGAVAFDISGDAATLAENTLTAVQAGTVTITASQAGNGNYNPAANVTHTITINKATPTVTAWPTLDAVTYGAKLEQALVLVGGTASVEGTFVITDAYTAATVPNAGTHTYSVEFRPTESNKYNNVSGGTATLTVNKADQEIAWDFADYTLLIGKTLELDATATCGAVTYVVNGTAISVSGTILTAMEEGTATIKATCAGDTNYNDVESMEYTITVEKDDEVTTGLDNTPSPMTNGQKIIYNGQLLIIRDGKTYNGAGCTCGIKIIHSRR